MNLSFTVKALTLVFLPLVAGCGDDIDPDTLVIELSEDEMEELCEDAPRDEPIECDGGVTFKAQTVDECVESLKRAPDSCTATVGELEACQEVAPCDRLEAPECSYFSECATSDG